MLMPKSETQNLKPETLITEPYTPQKVDAFNDALAEIYYSTVSEDVARQFLAIYPTSVEDAVNEYIISTEVEEAVEGSDGCVRGWGGGPVVG